MAKRADITPDLLRQLLRYEPETGKLFWRERSVDSFKPTRVYCAKHLHARWTTKCAGKECFTRTTRGYKVGVVFRMTFYAHRVIFAIVHGYWPEHDVDHIDGDRSNNRIENLRAVTRTGNRRNSALMSTNKSGVNGVWWNKNLSKWVVQIGAGKKVHLGCFSNFDDAVKRRKEAEVSLGFHPNHGRPLERSYSQ